MLKKLRIAIPKGSLEEGTINLFKQADLPIRRRNDRDYNLSIDDPRIVETFILRPKEIANYVSEGEFDFGITGLDWVKETEVAVREVADLAFSRGGWNPIKIILATNEENPVNDVRDISPKDRVVTEYPRMTRRYFEKLDKGKIKIRLSDGATEIKVPRLAEYLVDVTETGRTLRENGKKILDTIMVSSTKLIANIDSWNNPEKRQSMNEIAELLLGVVRARDKVMIKLNVSDANLNAVNNYLPAELAPTISLLMPRDESLGKWYAVETVIQKSQLNVIIPELKRLGARDILEIDVKKVIP
jgi:ATP phosphoribosyltransferase